MGSRRKCCCKGGTKICVKACGTTGPSGATVQIYTGSTLVEQCTTDSTGCCTLTSAGTYTLKVVASGVTTSFGSRTLNGTTQNAFLPVDGSGGYVCCGSLNIPVNLTASDAGGTFPMSHVSGSSPPTWTGGQSVSGTTLGGQDCQAVPYHAPGPGPEPVAYDMTCSGGTSFSARRQWFWTENNSGVGASFVWMGGSYTFTPGASSYLMPSPTIDCGLDASNPDFSQGTAAPSGTSPFAISFTMTPGPNTTSDPGGSSLSVSA